jgi:hypothetical protein
MAEILLKRHKTHNQSIQNQEANFNETWYKLFLGIGNSKLFKLRARSFSKGR